MRLLPRSLLGRLPRFLTRERRLPYPLRVLWQAGDRFFEHNGPDRAAAVSYYALLSLLPMLIFLISVGVAFLGSFEAAYEGTLVLMRGVVVPLDRRTLASLRDFVERATRFQWPGVLLLAWTSRRIFASLFSALERILGAPGRGFARHNLVTFGTVLVAGVALLLTMALIPVLAASEGLLLRFGAGHPLALGWRLVAEIGPPLVAFAFFFLIYRFVPRQVVSTPHAAVGALLATAMWEAAKRLFAYYLRNLARYAGVYGTLEGVVVLALWLEISASIILYCAEVVALVGQGRNQRRIAFEPPAEPAS